MGREAVLLQAEPRRCGAPAGRPIAGPRPTEGAPSRFGDRVGLLFGGWHFGHLDVMRERLLAQQIPSKDEYRVDLDRCLWKPWIEAKDDPPDGVAELRALAGR